MKTLGTNHQLVSEALTKTMFPGLKCFLGGKQRLWKTDEDFGSKRLKVKHILNQIHLKQFRVKKKHMRRWQTGGENACLKSKKILLLLLTLLLWLAIHDLKHLCDSYEGTHFGIFIHLYVADLPSLYSSGLYPRCLTSVATPSASFPCQLGHVSGHRDLYLNRPKANRHKHK